MNVESVQITTQGPKTKISKAHGEKEKFFQIYDQCINEKEKSCDKNESTNSNVSVGSNMNKKNSTIEKTYEPDEQVKDEIVNSIGIIGMPVNMVVYTNEQVSLSSIELGELVETESLLNSGEASNVLSSEILIETNSILPKENLLSINEIDSLEKNNTIKEDVNLNATKVKMNTLPSMTNLKDIALSQKNIQENNIATNKIIHTSNNEASVMQVQLHPDKSVGVDSTISTYPILPEENYSNANSGDSPFVKDQANLDFSFMVSNNVEEEISLEKKLIGTQVQEVKEESSSIMEKQEVNFNVRELRVQQLNSVDHVKETVQPDENLQRINDTIIKLVETTTQGNTSMMKVRLYPEELGSVDVTLKMEDGKLIAKILVENEQIKQMFANKINELSNNLIKHNITIDEIQINANSSSNYNGGSNQNKGSNLKRNHRSIFDTGPTDKTTTEDNTVVRSGSISILA